VPLASVSWSPDGTGMTTAGPGQSVLLWDLGNPRQPVQTRRLNIGGTANFGDLYGSARFSPDGRWLAADSGTGLAVFEVATGRRRWSSRLPENDFYSGLAFSPDGRTLAASSSALTGWKVTTWDVSSGKPGKTLEPPTAKSVAFARGGSVLVTATNISGVIGYGDVPYGSPMGAGLNRTGVSAVVMFDAATFQQIGEPLPLPQPDAVEVETSPDGTRVLAAMGGTAVIWDLDVTRWKQLACRIAGRNLTPTEWHRYLPHQPYRATCPQWPPGQ
jgi:WD40 repeat protein